MYNFVKDLFTFDSKEAAESLEETLEVLPEYNFNSFEISRFVIQKYATTFAKHFPKADSLEFVQFTHEALDIIEDCTIQYPELKATVKVITSMIEKFIAHEPEHSTTK